MKLIDNHNHLWVGQEMDAFTKTQPMGLARLLEDLDEAGVDMAGVCTVAQSMNNEYVLKCVKEHPDRLFGFAFVDPRYPDAVDQLKKMLDEGFVGLKLHPRLHGYMLDNLGIVGPLMEVCREYKVPMFAHGGSEEMNHPYQFEEVAKAYPDVTIIMGHMCTPNYCETAKKVAARNANVYLDNSAAEYLSVKTGVMMDGVGPEKILMGSDWPGSHFALSVQKTKMAAKFAKNMTPERAFEMMAGENIARILNIKI